MGKSLADWQEEYEYYSSKASEINRSLALGGLGIVWIFKNTDPTMPMLDKDFLWPLFVLVLSLLADLLHYVVGGLTWYYFYCHHERNTPLPDQADISAPFWKRNIVTSFFYIKVGLMITAYVLLVKILFSRIF